MTEMRNLDPDLTTVRADSLEPGDIFDLEPIARVFGDAEIKREIELGVSAYCYEYATVCEAPSACDCSRRSWRVHITSNDGVWCVPTSLLVHAIKKGTVVSVGGREMEV